MNAKEKKKGNKKSEIFKTPFPPEARLQEERTGANRDGDEFYEWGSTEIFERLDFIIPYTSKP